MPDAASPATQRELPDVVRRLITAGREQTLRTLRARTTDATANVSVSRRALP